MIKCSPGSLILGGNFRDLSAVRTLQLNPVSPESLTDSAERTCVHLGVPVDVQAAESPVPLKPFCAADVRDDVETGTSHSYNLKMLRLS